MAAGNHALEPDAIFHSDRGSQYTSAEYADKLTELDMRQSLGRTGICYDNALAESFFARLKKERVHRTVYPTSEAQPGTTLPGTSSCSTIDADSTPRSATRPQSRSELEHQNQQQAA